MAKPVFNDEQNRELRAALQQMKVKRHFSQVALGQILGIAQQNVGRLLDGDEGGFSYESATRLVRRIGFSGVDHFFARRGVALAKSA